MLPFVFCLLSFIYATNPPIVMVPGLAGSVLKMKLVDGPTPHVWCWKNADWFVTWVNTEELIPKQKDCFLERVQLRFDNTTGTYYNTSGVQIDSSVDFGGVGGIEYLDPGVKVGISQYWATMIKYFENLGYKRGENLHGAPYDWRLAPDGLEMTGYFDRLEALIESTYERNNASVFLVSHSLGCPTMLYFIRSRPESWVKTYIRAWFPLGGPFAGASTMALASVSGWNLGIPILPMDYVRQVQATSASGLFLFPEPNAFGDMVVASTPTRNYTAAGMLDILRAIGEEQALGINSWMTARKVQTYDLLSDNYVPPIPTFVIYGSEIDTPQRFIWDKEFKPGMTDAPKTIENGPGDGIVNLRSATIVESWGVTMREFKGVKHFDLVVNTNVLNTIKDFMDSV